ncbi:MAG: sigma-70 family RNA polymerase sigma factor [Bacteroidales bacterium]|nr:sigma-70 family RNA polymerase sigma factor [Bacteroidales bacterium]
MDEKELVEKCLGNDKSAQKLLYDTYSSQMMGLCMRYANSREEGEDILIEGFTKIFSNLQNFRFDSSLSAWMKKIMVNTAISHFRMHHKHHNTLPLENAESELRGTHELPSDHIQEKELLALIQRMPETYRVIFNLAVIEGYSHQEIGAMLDIQESTSRSQLTRARNWLKERL